MATNISYSDPAANSWIEQKNRYISAMNASNKAGYDRNMIHGFTPAPSVSAPSDMAAFRLNFGGGNASESDYQNWQIGQQRERTMGDFVNRMASGNPQLNGFQSQMQGDYNADRGNLNQYINTAAPTASNANRFESGLSDAEGRLKNLLDNPDSINQSAAYKFRLKQGEEAVQRQLGAKGLLNSGNRLMALNDYGQGMASQEYDNQYGRMSNLVGNYSQSWIGDKNANTNRYNAESQAWNQRGGLLKDILGGSQQGLTNATKIGSDDRNAWANTWVNANNKPGQWAPDMRGKTAGYWKG